MTSRTPKSSNLDLSFPGTFKGDSQPSTHFPPSVYLFDLDAGDIKNIDYFTLYCITEADKDNVGDSLECDKIKEAIAEKENRSKVYFCNICEISFMYEEGLFDYVSNIHNNCTICNI